MPLIDPFSGEPRKLTKTSEEVEKTVARGIKHTHFSSYAVRRFTHLSAAAAAVHRQMARNRTGKAGPGDTPKIKVYRRTRTN